MQIRKMGSGVAAAACVLFLMASTNVMATDAKPVKKDTAAVAAAAKQLKPQTTCPIMGGAINKKQFVDYKGKRIYVCCGGCIDPIKKDPEAAIKKLLDMGQEPENIAAVAPVKEGEKAAAKDTSVKGMDHSEKK